MIAPFTDEHFHRWERGWDRFVAMLGDLGRLAQVRVNRALWCHRTIQGSDFAPEMPDALIERANAHFERLYARTMRDLGLQGHLCYEPDLFVADEGHKWGKAPFHYAPVFYEATIRMLATEAANGSGHAVKGVHP